MLSGVRVSWWNVWASSVMLCDALISSHLFSHLALSVFVHVLFLVVFIRKWCMMIDGYGIVSVLLCHIRVAWLE